MNKIWTKNLDYKILIETLLNKQYYYLFISSSTSIYFSSLLIIPTSSKIETLSFLVHFQKNRICISENLFFYNRMRLNFVLKFVLFEEKLFLEDKVSIMKAIYQYMKFLIHKRTRHAIFLILIHIHLFQIQIIQKIEISAVFIFCIK